MRIDPSRQVSMDAAHMGFPSATEALNKLKNIKKSKNTPKSGNIIIFPMQAKQTGPARCYAAAGLVIISHHQSVTSQFAAGWKITPAGGGKKSVVQQD